jgi:hypothetical protein
MLCRLPQLLRGKLLMPTLSQRLEAQRARLAKIISDNPHSDTDGVQDKIEELMSLGCELIDAAEVVHGNATKNRKRWITRSVANEKPSEH